MENLSKEVVGKKRIDRNYVHRDVYKECMHPNLFIPSVEYLRENLIIKPEYRTTVFRMFNTGNKSEFIKSIFLEYMRRVMTYSILNHTYVDLLIGKFNLSIVYIRVTPRITSIKGVDLERTGGQTMYIAFRSSSRDKKTNKWKINHAKITINGNFMQAFKYKINNNFFDFKLNRLQGKNYYCIEMLEKFCKEYEEYLEPSSLRKCIRHTLFQMMRLVADNIIFTINTSPRNKKNIMWFYVLPFDTKKDPHYVVNRSKFYTRLRKQKIEEKKKKRNRSKNNG